MKILISNNRLVSDIQDEFNSFFPFLHLEFFDLAQDEMSNYIFTCPRHYSASVRDLRKAGKDGNVYITRNMTIMELEDLLQDEFDLKTQVFVRYGSAWLRSPLNGYWLISYKNDEGRRTYKMEDLSKS